MLICDCPPWPLSSHSPVLAELQQANLITSDECRGLNDASDVVRVQRSKSPEVLIKTADILRRHGFEKKSNHLTGKQTLPLIHVPVVCCTVEPSYKGRLKASIIILSFLHPVLGLRVLLNVGMEKQTRNGKWEIGNDSKLCSSVNHTPLERVWT